MDTVDLPKVKTSVNWKGLMGTISPNDLQRYGHRSNVHVCWSFDKKHLRVYGKTYKYRNEIRAVRNMPGVWSVEWDNKQDTPQWLVEMDPECDSEALFRRVSEYLLACEILQLKAITKKRKESLARARETRKATKAYATYAAEENAKHAPYRSARFAQLVTWRNKHATIFVYPFNREWYNATNETDRTVCYSCDLDALNHYGSDQAPFDDSLLPDKAFLEHCPHCKHHFFNNWN